MPLFNAQITQQLPGVGIAPTENINADLRESAADGLTAHAGGGQASALALTSVMNRVTTVGTAADSVVLPPAVVGLSVVVVNAAAANAMNVFPASQAQGGAVGGDAINALTQNTAISVAANKTIMFCCVKAGVWNSILTA